MENKYQKVVLRVVYCMYITYFFFFLFLKIKKRRVAKIAFEINIKEIDCINGELDSMT